MMKKYLSFKMRSAFLTGILMLSIPNLFGQVLTTLTYSYTGAVQSFVIPALCVHQVTIETWGAEGGGSVLSGNTSSGLGGKGGYAAGTLSVVPGNTLFIYVGGYGQSSTSGVALGGFNGGGDGYASSSAEPGNGGGGATDVRFNGQALTNRIIVAGGGGGGGEDSGDSFGHGGGLTGVGYTAYDATQTAPGPGGALGVGGGTGLGDGGGGGGGYYGGGSLVGTSIGTDTQGGGGGSGYTGGVLNTTLTAGNAIMPNPAGGTMSGRSGHGFVRITYYSGNAIAVSASPTVICNGGTSTLTASGVSTYTWSTGSTSTSIPVSPTSNTTYTISGTDVSGCTSSLTISVPVNTAVPTLTVTNTANSGGICPTKTVVLTASGAITYTWTGGSTAVTNGVAFAPMTAADYTVNAGNACGISSAVTSVSVHPLPNITPVASTSSLCSGGSLTLTGVGNSTNYAWSGFTSAITDGVGFFPLVTATYSVIGTSALSCTALATIPVTVVTTPVLAPTFTPAIVCLGGSATLTASGATNYTWSSASQTVYTNPLIITPGTPGSETYTVTKANANCVDTKVLTITTNPLPVVFAIATPTIVCSLSTSTLAVAGGQTYTWTAPNGVPFTGASPVVTPSASTIYTVAAHDGTCINTTTVLVATNPIPTISVVASSSLICRGQSVSMTASGGMSYTWTALTGTFYTNPVTDTPSTSVSYNVKGNNAFGCTSSYNQIVLVNPIPTVAIQVVKPLVCSGGLSTLTASGANTYTWDANANGVTTASAVVTSTALASGPAIYTVTATYTNSGCQNTKTVQVNVFVPVLTVTGNTNTCMGGNVTLSGSGGNNGSYSWNTGTGNVSGPVLTTSLTAPAVFTLNAMTNSASIVCPASKTVALGIYYNPTITAVAQRTTICRFEKVELYGDGGVTYNWNNGMSGQTVTIGPVNQIQTLNYTVTGTDANGCSSTGTVQVKVSGCTGISESNGTDNVFVVYPNPSNGEFTISSPTDITLILSNELGQIIRSISLSALNNHQVSVSDLSKGIYFLSGQKDNVQINQKVIIAK